MGSSAATVEMRLISEIFRFGFLKELYDIMRAEFNRSDASGLVPITNPAISALYYHGPLHGYAQGHLKFVMNYGVDRHTSEVMRPDKGRMQTTYPEYFDAWVVAGCPGISLMSLERVIVDAAGLDADGLFQNVDPSDFEIKLRDSNPNEGLIADALKMGKAAKLLELIEATDPHAPLRRSFARCDPYSQRLTIMAALHLRRVLAWQYGGGVIEGEDNVIGIASPYSECFKAWVLDDTPGLTFDQKQVLSDELYAATRRTGHGTM